jgi:hypothetical protein
MSPMTKKLLVIEVIICFSPIIFLLIMGTVFLPQQLYFLVKYGEVGSLIVVVLTIGGWLGLISLIIVLNKLLNDSSERIINNKLVVVFLALGTVSLVSADQFVLGGIYRAVSLLPLICTLHIIYIGRKFLFSQ